MLKALRAVVDVQHLYRFNHPLDRGTEFVLANGTHTTEASAAVLYAASLVAWLRTAGATVLTNDPMRQVLVGPYSRRNLSALDFGADAYLACHVNAGGGDYGLMEYMSTTTGRALADAIGPRLTAAFPPIRSVTTRALSTTDRGAVCIRLVPGGCATIICEPFFGDTPAHQGLFAAPELARLGATLGQGIADWWLARSLPA